eukprot:3525388-Rhodomonas_salina.3
MRCLVLAYRMARACSAKSGSDIAYAIPADVEILDPPPNRKTHVVAPHHYTNIALHSELCVVVHDTSSSEHVWDSRYCHTA